MPNYCHYEMKIVGIRKENIEDFIKIMKSNYDYNTMEFEYERHMGGRVFEAKDNGIEETGNGLYETYISGYCAWSILCCMFDGAFTYYRNLMEKYKDRCRSTTIPIESKRLNLDIEIYSEESGMGFQEHYLVRKGDVEIEDCIDYGEYDITDFKTKAEAEEKLNTEITDEEWEKEDYISRGGFENWEFAI